ncbi:exodeoxyribonuclease VII large subunit [Desulfonatronovibrio magnus]|uniref:exodeoxyribonuclease VII large subunit n=1 Tax=Desulfonatronovibrio magnus TaxID=698827 RepID=UPI0005EB080F|nr:exodeoxyribonuclease VII large subunit [Desulfonatronovibrio magnus]
MPHIFSVAELTSSIKELVEVHFPFIWVRGQVSNLSRPGSGHIYFSLKDDQAGLQVAWFKNTQPFSRQNKADPAATLENGQDVVCAGKIGVYAPRGTYQLIAELVQEQGLGDLFLAFEALKKKLQAQGYFDESRKRPVPYSPDRVAVVTAPTGAVIHDFTRVAEDLGLGSEIRVYPCLVQGDRAPGQIVKAIKLANEHAWAQLIVVMRGGGSLEDLWAFNDEQVAHAIFESTLPVLTGIGHETDTTIADLTADKRVATPSQAAQSLWPQRKDLAQKLDEMELTLIKSYSNYLKENENELNSLIKALGWLSPAHRMQRLEERLEALKDRLIRAMRDVLQNRSQRLADLSSRLRFRFGPEFWDMRSNELSYLESRLLAGGQSLHTMNENRLNIASQRLSDLDPHGPLKRGYSLVEVDKTGQFLRGVKDVQSGDGLKILVLDGRIKARVE